MPSTYSSHAVDCTVEIDASTLAGKTAIVTGGANGIGEGFVRALHAAKAVVVIGDLNATDGEDLAAKLPGTKFVKCDVSSWQDQVHLFEEAIKFSPSGKIHYVIPNAGIAATDEVFTFDGVETGPQKPSLKTIEINLCGVLYTCKLAMHYFIRQNGMQPSSKQEDTCLVLIGSGAAFLDCPRGPQYAATKYVRTSIIPASAFNGVENQGVVLATVEEAGQCLLRILSDPTVNGRMVFLSGKKWSDSGYLDLDIDDYHDDPCKDIQKDQLLGAPPEDGLFLEGRW